MYAQAVPISSACTSLNNSTVASTTPFHSRTQSFGRLPTSPQNNHPYIRIPSQKKLTLTSQNIPPTSKVAKNSGDSELKKKPALNFERPSYFVSMGSSRIFQCETVYSRAEVQNSYLNDLRQNFEDRFKQLEAAYSQNLTYLTSQIRELQVKLLKNSQQLQDKTRKINELQERCKFLNKKKNESTVDISGIIFKKIRDLEIKIKILADHCQLIENKQNDKVEELTNKVISYYGNKLVQLRQRNNIFAQYGLTKIVELEEVVQIIKKQQQKHLQKVKGSMQTVGSDASLNYHNEHYRDQNGASFWDDCFFYPSQHTQNFEHILEITKYRDQPLSCWIDNQGHIRSTDTNSFIFNRRGERIILSQGDIDELIAQKRMILF